MSASTGYAALAVAAPPPLLLDANTVVLGGAFDAAMGLAMSTPLTLPLTV